MTKNADRVRVRAKLQDLETAVERSTVTRSFAAFAIKQLLPLSRHPAIVTLDDARRAHSLLVRCGHHRATLAGNLMLQLFANLGSIAAAKEVFDAILAKNLFSWSIMIAALVTNGNIIEARSLFRLIPQRDRVCCTAVITGCSRHGEIQEAARIFAEMDLEGEDLDDVAIVAAAKSMKSKSEKAMRDVAFEAGAGLSSNLGNSLVSMHGRFGDLREARAVYERIARRDVSSLTALVTAYAQNGHLEEATALFDRMPQRDTVSFNAMLAALARNGEAERALDLFESARRIVTPDRATLSILLDACASVVGFTDSHVRSLAGFLLREDREVLDLKLATGLLRLLAKNGNLTATRIFDEKSLHSCDVVAWNAMIAASAEAGDPARARRFLWKLELYGFRSDEVTLLSVLSALSHSGLWLEALQTLQSFEFDLRVRPGLDHYKSLSDLLGRVGRLEESHELLRTMPIEPDVNAWKSLLSASKLHGDVERAVEAARVALVLDPDMSSIYSLLADALYPR